MAARRRPWLLLVGATVAVVLCAWLVLVGRPGTGDAGSSHADPGVLPSLADPAGDRDRHPSRPVVSAPAAEPVLHRVTLRVSVHRAEDGRPLSDAQVSVRRLGALTDQGVTDVDGLWTGILRGSPGPVTLRVEAADHLPDERTVLILEGVDAEVSVALLRRQGWHGRVVTELGDPLPGVTVILRRSWPARPASAWDGETLLVTRPADVSASQRLVTDEEGVYLVPAVPRDEVVDLLLRVETGALISELLRIPLPLSFGALPDLVARESRWATGVVVDESGEALPGARVQLDPSPGPWRRVQEEYVVGATGGFTLKLGVEPRHVRAQASGRWLVSARAGDEVLPLVPGDPRPWEQVTALDPTGVLGTRGLMQRRLPADSPVSFDEPWVTVPAGTGAVELVMAQGARVAGVVRSYETGRRLSGARVLLRHEGELLAVTEADREGLFGFDLPPEWAGPQLELVIDHAGSERLVKRVNAVRDPDAFLPPLSLRWSPPDEVVRGQLTMAGGLGVPYLREGTQLELAAYRWPGSWVPAHELPVERHPAWERLTPPLWDDLAFRFADRLQLGESLLVVARATAGDGERYTSWWGPGPVVEARTRGVALPSRMPGSLLYSVEGVPDGERLHEVALSWDPWLDHVQTRRASLYEPGRGNEVRAVQVAPFGVHTLELREDRRPVHHRLAGLTEWLDVRPSVSNDTQVLVHPGRHAVSGQVVWHGADGWPDTCVALLGEGVPDWRLPDLGAWDTWARPDQHGRFRIDDVPAGDYAFVLYRPVGDHAVELLAERQVTVGRDLFHLDIWAAPEGDPLRRVVVSPWGVPDAEAMPKPSSR